MSQDFIEFMEADEPDLPLLTAVPDDGPSRSEYTNEQLDEVVVAVSPVVSK